MVAAAKLGIEIGCREANVVRPSPGARRIMASSQGVVPSGRLLLRQVSHAGLARLLSTTGGLSLNRGLLARMCFHPVGCCLDFTLGLARLRSTTGRLSMNHWLCCVLASADFLGGIPAVFV